MLLMAVRASRRLKATAKRTSASFSRPFSPHSSSCLLQAKLSEPDPSAGPSGQGHADGVLRGLPLPCGHQRPSHRLLVHRHPRLAQRQAHDLRRRLAQPRRGPEERLDDLLGPRAVGRSWAQGHVERPPEHGCRCWRWRGRRDRDSLVHVKRCYNQRDQRPFCGVRHMMRGSEMGAPSC